jgi:DNA oxidative demethylase
MNPLFDAPPPSREPLEEGAVLLRGFALADVPELLREIEAVAAVSPFRHLVVPGGHTMSVAMTNCGRVGWVSDRSGYRYDPIDPDTGRRWPDMPSAFLGLAVRAAAEAGFPGYDPDACLINRYAPGAKLGLHQDKDEKDPISPIVSVSLGVSATFLWGGKRRADPVRRMRLEDGDVAVWGGPARFVYHGVAPVKNGVRLNLTFRKVF